jgi:hypothetical protein
MTVGMSENGFRWAFGMKEFYRSVLWIETFFRPFRAWWSC